MTAILVSPLDHAQEQIDTHGCRQVLSLLGPDMAHRSFARIGPGDHLKLTFHDITEPMAGFTHPGREHVEEIIAFIENWHRSAPILIHCWAGISRSTASAFTALCMARPDEDETSLAWELRKSSPSATPNRLIVAHADAILGRRGRMLKAIDAIGRGQNAYLGTPFKLEI